MESCETRNMLLKLLLFDRCKLGDLPKQTDPKREAAIKRCFSKKVLQIGVLQYILLEVLSKSLSSYLVKLQVLNHQLYQKLHFCKDIFQGF